MIAIARVFRFRDTETNEIYRVKAPNVLEASKRLLKRLLEPSVYISVQHKLTVRDRKRILRGYELVDIA